VRKSGNLRQSKGERLKVASSFLLFLALFSLLEGCSSGDQGGTTIQFTRPPALSPVSTISAAAQSTSVGSGHIGGQTTGGKPRVMTHPVQGYENCISCHGVDGSAQSLVFEITHPCEQCHATVPEPSWGSHDNNAMNDLPRLNASCLICHKPLV